MTNKTSVKTGTLERWQIDDAARLKALFAKKKAEMRDRKEPFTQELFAEANGFTAAAMVWQLLNAHRPLNIKAAAAFARGLGVRVEDFSPTLARQIEQVAESHEPASLRAVPAPAGRRLQWVEDDEAELLSEYRACAQDQKSTALSLIQALPKAIVQEAGLDQD